VTSRQNPALSTGTQSASADILRCGSVLIETGDSARRVLEKCGQPSSKTTVNEPVWTHGANGAVESITFEKSRG
jgi:hypothetical protein